MCRPLKWHPARPGLASRALFGLEPRRWPVVTVAAIFP
ncbi:hypothetical protein LHGZ1_2449 [Laribacter hongkongensis]|uniref:Uncharacterized protein n=1 Tax=Laribacter hongkongensis TaxID=168471 RepID=A0A248LKG6_9NEIS|nr:hypothetical protein LHGZ1_2449 [Laribacter hongkongensis]